MARVAGVAIVHVRTLPLICLLVALLAANACGAPTAGSYAPYDSLPAGYSPEDAKRDGCVVFEDWTVTSGRAAWEDFVARSAAGEAAVVRLALYSTEQYEALKEPVMVIQDLSYDGTRYTLSFAVEGKQYVHTYAHMKKIVGQMPTGEMRFTRYELHDAADAEWDEAMQSMFSAQADAWVKHMTAYFEIESLTSAE